MDQRRQLSREIALLPRSGGGSMRLVLDRGFIRAQMVERESPPYGSTPPEDVEKLSTKPIDDLRQGAGLSAILVFGPTRDRIPWFGLIHTRELVRTLTLNADLTCVLRVHRRFPGGHGVAIGRGIWAKRYDRLHLRVILGSRGSQRILRRAAWRIQGEHVYLPSFGMGALRWRLRVDD